VRAALAPAVHCGVPLREEVCSCPTTVSQEHHHLHPLLSSSLSPPLQCIVVLFPASGSQSVPPQKPAGSIMLPPQRHHHSAPFPPCQPHSQCIAVSLPVSVSQNVPAQKLAGSFVFSFSPSKGTTTSTPPPKTPPPTTHRSKDTTQHTHSALQSHCLHQLHRTSPRRSLRVRSCPATAHQRAQQHARQPAAPAATDQLTG
jgi:hypothetical protein